MEKNADIKPGKTPDTERRLPQGEKQGGDQAATKALDNDVTKRLADGAAKSLR